MLDLISQGVDLMSNGNVGGKGDGKSGGRAGKADHTATPRKIVLISVMLAGIAVVGVLSGGLERRSSTNFVFFWCFVIFTVGLAELFLLFLWLTVLGKIDLKQAFQDKELLKPGESDEPSISLS